MNLSKRCVNCGEQCISHIEFLEGLDEEKQNRVKEGAVRRTCRKGSSLFRQGDPVDAVYIIHTGRVKLCTWDPEGREQIVGLFSDKDTIWEGIFIEGSRYPYSAVCMTDVYCCRVMRKDLEKVMEDPAIAMRVIGLLSRKLHEANERVMLLSSSSPRVFFQNSIFLRPSSVSSPCLRISRRIRRVYPSTRALSTTERILFSSAVPRYSVSTLCQNVCAVSKSNPWNFRITS